MSTAADINFHNEDILRNIYILINSHDVIVCAGIELILNVYLWRFTIAFHFPSSVPSFYFKLLYAMHARMTSRCKCYSCYCSLMKLALTFLKVKICFYSTMSQTPSSFDATFQYVSTIENTHLRILLNIDILLPRSHLS